MDVCGETLGVALTGEVSSADPIALGLSVYIVERLQEASEEPQPDCAVAALFEASRAAPGVAQEEWTVVHVLSTIENLQESASIGSICLPAIPILLQRAEANANFHLTSSNVRITLTVW